jgi:hypothetical protein
LINVHPENAVLSQVARRISKLLQEGSRQQTENAGMTSHI